MSSKKIFKTLNDLNDDVLIKIFLNLQLKERLRLERVCSRWRSLIPYSDIDKVYLADFDFRLAVRDLFWEEMGHWQQKQQILVNKTLIKLFKIILSRCKNLQEISFKFEFADFKVLLGRTVLRFIGEHGKSLKSLDLSGVYLRVNAIQTLVSHCPSVEKINMKDVKFADVKLNRPTKYLGDYKLPLERLVNDHPSLRTILFHNMRYVCRIENAQLETLSYQRCPVLESTDLIKIARGCPNLRKVDLRCCRSLETPEIGLSLLKNLQELDISDGNDLNSLGLYQICKNHPKLTHLNIQKCHNITTYYDLLLLEKLQVIKVGPSSEFSDDLLIELANKFDLLGVDILSCNHVTNPGVITLAEKCSNLQNFGISGCPVTAVGITTLIQSCKDLRKLQFMHPAQTISAEICLSLAELSKIKVFDFSGIYKQEWIRSLARRRKQRRDNGEVLVRLYIGWIWNSLPKREDKDFENTLEKGNIGKLLGSHLEDF